MNNNSNLLSINDLSTWFYTQQGLVRAVQNVSFDVPAGQTVAVVGESGCGKSVTALSILRLIPHPPGKIVGGQITFKGRSILELSAAQMRAVRGNEIAMIFQEPMTSLNPVFTVGNQIVESLALHRKITGAKAWAIAEEMLTRVGIAAPSQRVREYPHQLSGGMRQRVMIAMALCCSPSLLIADEPTTALDVTIQAQILELLREIQKQNQMSIMLITHDLGVVAETAQQVVVMYASRVVEKTDTASLFAEPLHPYTQGLMRSMPRLGQKKDRLDVIGGSVPNPLVFPSGCKFHPRCPVGCGDKRCQTEEPAIVQVQPGHWVACWYAKNYHS